MSWSVPNKNGLRHSLNPFAEAKWASVLGGSSIDAAEECIEHGFWQKPSIDPSTCATGSVRIPIGNFTRGTAIPLCPK